MSFERVRMGLAKAPRGCSSTFKSKANTIFGYDEGLTVRDRTDADTHSINTQWYAIQDIFMIRGLRLGV
jgi:hypothetical protein